MHVATSLPGMCKLTNGLWIVCPSTNHCWIQLLPPEPESEPKLELWAILEVLLRIGMAPWACSIAPPCAWAWFGLVSLSFERKICPLYTIFALQFYIQKAVRCSLISISPSWRSALLANLCPCKWVHNYSCKDINTRVMSQKRAKILAKAYGFHLRLRVAL